MIKKNNLILLSREHGDDYSVDGILKATEDFDIEELAEEYRQATKNKYYENYGEMLNIWDFEKWLVERKQVAEIIPYIEINHSVGRHYEPGKGFVVDDLEVEEGL